MRTARRRSAKSGRAAAAPAPALAAALTLAAVWAGVAHGAVGPGCVDGTLCFDDALPQAPLPCYPGYYCPGNQTAMLCPAGSYCPTTTSIAECPAGYYCPPSTVDPKRCSPFASCPAGSDRYVLWGGVLLALLPFVLLLGYKHLVVARSSLASTQPSVGGSSGGGDKFALPSNTAGGGGGGGGSNGWSGGGNPPALRSPGSAAAATSDVGTGGVPSPVASADSLSPFSDAGATMRLLARLSVAERPANVDDDAPDDAAAGAVVSGVNITGPAGSVAVPIGNASTAAFRAMAVRQPVDLRFDRLVSSVDVGGGKRKVIMASVTGQFRAGRVAAVMGPSGAGKTTLFRILMGKLPVTGGAVLLNDAPADPRQSAGRCGLASQADVMLATLTVRDVLVHAARTRLPATMSDAAKLARVDDLLRALSLTHIQHSIVGDAESGQRGISGGERKRVSIGIELVANPSVLLLDEPTTGLDSTTSLDVVQLLKRIAQTQRVTVVAVLHQPRNLIFELFDDLLLLAPGGRTVYSGSAHRALPYFASQQYACPPKANPADHFIDVISGAFVAGAAAADAAAVVAATPVAASAATTPAAKDQKQAAGGPGAAGAADVAHAAEVQAKLVAAWQAEEANPASVFVRGRGGPLSPANAAATANGHDSANGAAGGGATKSGGGSDELAGAGWFAQVWLNLRRGLLQQTRGAALNVVLLELAFHLFAGVVIGIAFIDQNWFLPPLPPAYSEYCPAAMRDVCKGEPFRDVLPLAAAFTVMSLGLIAAVTGVRTFGAELLNTSREVAAGGSLSAYFVGKALGDLPGIVAYSLVFTATFCAVAAPNAPFDQLYLVMVLFEFALFALGYVCSVLFAVQENALLMAVVAPLLAGLATDNETPVKSFAWSRWASEAMFLTEIRADTLQGVTRDLFQAYADLVNWFDLDNLPNDLLALVVFGVVLRLMALGLLYRRQRIIEAST